MKSSVLVYVALFFVPSVLSLDNGLARTPVMGWLSWARFFCQTDCLHHPTTCINQELYTDMADRIVEDGYLAVGYDHVNVDDCWMAMKRDANNRLVADKDRFPNGIPYLASYMHAKGLKLGVYEDYGTKTCGGYPGSLNYLEIDAETFAQWNVDMLKLDGCYADPKTMDKGYPMMTKFLNQTGRPIVFSCSWPDYIRDELKTQPNYTWIAENCNMWRNYGDIFLHWSVIADIIRYFDANQDIFIPVHGPGHWNDPDMPNYKLVAENCNMWRNFDDIFAKWDSIAGIINYYDHNQDILIPVHGPGHWNDPDMIVVGNPELTVDQSRAQMTIWCMWSAPLLMSNDLRLVTNEMKTILQNKLAIRVDQDPLGKMARLVANTSHIGAYVKEMTPVRNGKYSYAIAFLNRDTTDTAKVSTKLSNLNITNPAGYRVTNVWSEKQVGTLLPTDSIGTVLPPTSADMWILEVL